MGVLNDASVVHQSYIAYTTVCIGYYYIYQYLLSFNTLRQFSVRMRLGQVLYSTFLNLL